MDDHELAAFRNKPCLVDLENGQQTGTLVQLDDGRYRMKNLLGSMENPTHVVYFIASQVKRIRPL
jgi:hypothetical protein